MATTDWPLALIPQTCQLTLRKAGLQFTSPFNGTTQALDFVAERWVLSASLAQMAARNPRGVGSFCNRLAGGVERVRGWHFGHNRGVPMGTLRGVTTLAAGLVRGDTSLSVTGALARPNLLVNSSFEIDTNADGMSDGWTGYTAAGTPATTYFRNTDTGATWDQRISIPTAVTAGHEAGILTIDFTPVSAGLVYTFSADVAVAPAGYNANIVVGWYNAAGGLISTTNTLRVAGFQWARESHAGLTAPPLATQAKFSIGFIASAALANLSGAVNNVQFEQAAAATPYAGLATLLADDMLGAGGQLFQVATNCTANDAGAITVPVVNRVRATIASGTAVVWSQPTAEFIMPAMQSGPVYRPGAIDSAALDLVEVWG